MSQIDQFLAALKRALKVKGIVYRDLAKALQLSESSVKRILASKSLTLERLEEICTATEIPFSEVCKLAEFSGDTDSEYFTEEQERTLAESPRLFHYAMLLTDGYTPQKILRDYEVRVEEAQKFLLTLDRLKLIELHPRDRVKVGASAQKRFRKEGPMGKIIFEQARDSFLQSRFSGKEELVRFQNLHLSPTLFAKAQARLEKIMAELRDEAAFENPDTTATFGILFAIRPWKYTWMESIKKRK